MPGWRKLFEVYQEEFGLRPAADRPLALILVLTDGEAADVAEFAYALSNLPPLVYVAVGIVGFGGEHERCLRSFVPVAARQPRVRIVQLDPRGSNAAGLADALERMFRAPVSATAWL